MRKYLPALLALLSTAAAHEFPTTPPPRNDIRIENRVAVPMRDGVVLYADVYRPAADGKYPVIVSRTPYSTERYPSAYAAAVYFSRRGYVYVSQDVRGRHESEGRWEPFRDDVDDGYDTIEWAAKQPWSNGKVGMDGGSYLGQVQWRAAQARPPHLVTIFPRVASTSIYHDWITVNGGWRLAFNFGWGPVRQESRIMQNTGPHTMAGGPEGISYNKVVWHLPLTGMQGLVGRNAQFYKDWLAHPDYDDYWRKVSVEEHFDKINVPVHTMGGFFDIFAQGTLRGYKGVSKKGATEEARKGSHMVIGPWEHGVSRKVGDIDWGAAAAVDTSALALRWFDYWLAGVRNGLDSEPPVKVFVMGRNQWRYENEYPLARTQYKPLYLASGGHANGSHGDGSLSWQSGGGGTPDRYRYDPRNPVPSLGGANCCGVGTTSGARDQRPIEHREDILVYTSALLEEEVEVVGPVKLVLHASSSAVDTDFVAKLVDVYPDGRSINVAEGILRARYRNSLSAPELLEPGKVYRMAVDMIGTANVFQKGHRIRVHVTSSHFPQFSRNLNTGEPFGTGTAMKVAEQTVHHSSERPSHVLLPVIPQ
ncbi:MAG: CocE/NonD family hydrolase [bacterium]|nr:CocE/NonD family hydrolase [bacterium]